MIKLHENLVICKMDNDWYYVNEEREKKLKVKNSVILNALNSLSIDEILDEIGVSEYILLKMINELEFKND